MSRDPTAQAVESPFLKLAEAADFARVSVRTIRRQTDAGHLKAHRIGGRILIRRDELERLLSPQARDS